MKLLDNPKVYVTFHYEPASRITVAELYYDSYLGLGSASCSVKDQFTRKHGRKIALKRAIGNVFSSDSLWLNKTQRKEIWDAFFKRCKR